MRYLCTVEEETKIITIHMADIGTDVIIAGINGPPAMMIAAQALVEMAAYLDPICERVKRVMDTERAIINAEMQARN